MPDWLEPMAATLTEERFSGPEWIFEQKFDGIRGLAFKRGRDVRILSRNRLPQHRPDIIAELQGLACRECILDGELSWHEQPSGYDVFDVLWLDGRDLTGLPLIERRTLLRTLLRTLPPTLLRTEGRTEGRTKQRTQRRTLVRVAAEVTGERPWEHACKLGWEGVIAKRRDSRYEHRRSKQWLKMKCEASQELVVGGFTDPQGARVGYGALLVGYYDGGDFVFAGKVGTSQGVAALKEMRAKLDALEISKSPFTRAVGLPRKGAHWVKPEIVVQVQFIEWTTHGKLRHARLIAVRTDKTAQECVRES
jgi:bifunctional non-homologous end joining protein LigD